MATQEDINNSNTIAIESNTASILGILKSIQTESARATASESAILSSLDKAIEEGSIVDMKKSIVATEALISPSEQLSANIGTVYLLTEEQENYIKNRMYRLEFDESDSSFSSICRARSVPSPSSLSSSARESIISPPPRLRRFCVFSLLMLSHRVSFAKYGARYDGLFSGIEFHAPSHVSLTHSSASS